MRTKRAVAFGAVFVVLLLLLSKASNEIYKFYGTTLPGKYLSLVELQKEPENTIDALTIGDSLSYTSISPMTLWQEEGIAGYVCGQPGQQLSESYYNLKQILERQSPKVLMIETNMLFRKPKGISKIQAIFNDMGMYYFSLIRYHNMWKNMVNRKSPDMMYFKGYYIRDQVAGYDGGAYMRETDKRKELSPYTLEYMDKIIELCREKNIQILLYSAPSPKNYTYRKHNALTAYAKEQGISYLDMNLLSQQIPIDWARETVDRGDHLNIAGTKKVSEYMAGYLKEQYELTDHRQEVEYASWNKLQEKYVSMIHEKVGAIEHVGG